MANFLDVLDSVAKIVGGTVDPTNPRFFSGAKAGDATGIQAPVGDPSFKGCFSVPPDSVTATPIAVLEPGPFKSPLGHQGLEENTDELMLWVCVGRADLKEAMRLIVPYRDLVPAAFRAAMTAGRATTGDNTQIAYAHVISGEPRSDIEIAGTTYVGWRFTVEVFRAQIPSYAV